MTERTDFILNPIEYFPGANTPYGFYSYYSHILKADEAKKIIVLKGGPGTGKSSFMKKIGGYFSDNGYTPELLHCSSDPDSLDGVCIREHGFLILDGTSPHTIDPSLPGAIDEIINLGDFWDAGAIRPHKERIANLTSDIKNEFNRAYAYLNAALTLKKQIKYDIGFDSARVYTELEKLRKALKTTKFSSGGSIRKAFLSALTHRGKVSFAKSFEDKAEHIVRIISDYGGASEEFMAKTADMLYSCGGKLRAFYDFMNPEGAPEFIFEETRKIFFTTERGSDSEAKEKMVIDFTQNEENGYDPTPSKGDMRICDELFSKATEALRNAKSLHDDLESYYIPHMDFGKVEAKCKELTSTLKRDFPVRNPL